MLDAQFSADDDGMISSDLFVGSGESIRELVGVVGQYFLDHHGRHAFESPQESMLLVSVWLR